MRYTIQVLPTSIVCQLFLSDTYIGHSLVLPMLTTPLSITWQLRPRRSPVSVPTSVVCWFLIRHANVIYKRWLFVRQLHLYQSLISSAHVNRAHVNCGHINHLSVAPTSVFCRSLVNRAITRLIRMYR